MTGPDSDIRELVEKARTGCSDAFGKLASLFGPRLTVLIRVEIGPSLRNRVIPEDILQTVLIKAWRGLPRLEWQNDGAFYKWLSTIAVRTVIDAARDLRDDHEDWSLDELTQSKSWVAAIDSRVATPGTRMVEQERFHRLEAALHKLEADHRRIIVLTRLCGLSMAEAAEELNCTPGAASMRLLRALRALRTIFGDTGSFTLPPWSIDPEPKTPS